MADFNQSWWSLSPAQRLAAIGYLEADNGPNNERDSYNVMHATNNRAKMLGWDTDRVINYRAPGATYGWYQPLWEPAARARLPGILSRPDFAARTQYAEGVLSGDTPSTVGDATHFVARNIESLAAREPWKYRTFRTWATPSNYRPVEDSSHNFYRVGAPAKAPSVADNFQESDAQEVAGKKMYIPMPDQTQPAASAAPPVVTSGVAPPLSPYSQMLARALLDTKLSAAPGKLEGLSYALSKGVGGYLEGRNSAEDRARQDWLGKQVAAMPGIDPVMANWAQVNPKEALPIYLADKRAAATAAQQEKSNDLQFQRQVMLELIKSGNKMEAPDMWVARKNPWTGMEETIHKVYGISPQQYKNLRDAGSIPGMNTGQTALSNALSGVTPGAPPSQAVQEQKVNGTPGELTSPGVSAPVAGNSFGPRAGGTAAAVAGPPPSASSDVSRSQSLAGVTIAPDGKTGTLEGGRKVNLTTPDGKPIPPEVFLYAHDVSPNPDALKAARESAYKYNDEWRKAQREAADLTQKTKSMVEDFNLANDQIATGAGDKGISLLQNIANRLGLQTKGLPQQEAMNALTTELSKVVRQGFPGSVSNYEMQLYEKASMSAGNSRVGNYLIGQRFKYNATLQDEKMKLAREYISMKKQARLEAVVDHGFDDLWNQRLQNLRVYSPQDIRIMELAASGDMAGAERELDAARGVARASGSAGPPNPGTLTPSRGTPAKLKLPDNFPAPGSLGMRPGQAIEGPNGQKLRVNATGTDWE